MTAGAPSSLARYTRSCWPAQVRIVVSQSLSWMSRMTLHGAHSGGAGRIAPSRERKLSLEVASEPMRGERVLHRFGLGCGEWPRRLGQLNEPPQRLADPWIGPTDLGQN